MFQFTQPQTPLRDAITGAYRLDEVTAVSNLLATLNFDNAQKEQINALARRLITQVRADRSKSSASMH